MKKSDDNNELEDETSLAEVDYLIDSSTLPREISEAIEPEQYTIQKDAKLSWDGRQLMVRIPLEITNEMGINKDNKSEFKVHFEFVKPAPNTIGEKKVIIELIKAL